MPGATLQPRSAGPRHAAPRKPFPARPAAAGCSARATRALLPHVSSRPERSSLCRASFSQGGPEDPDFAEALNEVCTKALRVMLDVSEPGARQLERELRDTQAFLLEERETEAARFLGVLLAMLRHTVPGEASKLRGPYSKAFTRLLNQVQGSGWGLAGAGQASGAPPEPRFTTWEDVLSGRAGKGSSSSSAAGSGAGAGAARAGGPLDRTYYDRLGVEPHATQAEVKAAYRALALRTHPDVSAAPDAANRFAALAAAYDVLSDPDSRRLYDRYGLEGMGRHAGAGSGAGNAAAAWDEFKPYKRQNKHTRARDASRASYSSSLDADDGGGGGSASGSDGGAASAQTAPPAGPAADERRSPQPGDVVEYPLCTLVMEDLQDGRSKGVGLLVARNMDRGDAAKLPHELLGLCEVEPLRQCDPGSARWMPDELGCATFVQLADLAVVPVAGYDPRFDVWTIDAPLSEGCGGPELSEGAVV